MVSEAYAAEGMVAKQTLQETVKLLSLWLSNIIDLSAPFRLAAVSALLAHAQGPPYSQRQFCLINPLAR